MKRLFTYLCIAIVAFFAVACEDDNYTTSSSIRGVVIDEIDNTPIAGVLVTNQNTGRNCKTPADGRYEFNNLEFGKTYKIRAEKTGYIPSTQNIMPSEVRDNIEVYIKMERRP